VRVRLLVAYHGRRFKGLAPQPDQRTVVGELAAGIAKVLRMEAPTLAMSGRTDAGVHAWGQVLSFDAPEGADVDTLARRLTRLLGPEIVVRSAEAAPPDFDARHSAKGRRYRYTVLHRAVPDPFLAATTWWVPDPLDVRAMQGGCDPLIGVHDFGAFCRRQGDRSLVRDLRSAEWLVLGDGLLRFDVEASSFCQQMVRSLVGTQGRSPRPTVWSCGRSCTEGVAMPVTLVTGGGTRMTTCPRCNTDDFAFKILDGKPTYICKHCGDHVVPNAERPPEPKARLRAGTRGGRSRDPLLLEAIVAEVATHGGVATKHDIRALVGQPGFDTASNDLDWNLVHLADDARPPLLYRPFGNAGWNGDEVRRQRWLKSHRPGQPSRSNQVWALTPSARRGHLDEASSVAPDEALEERCRTYLLAHFRDVVPAETGDRAERLLELLGATPGAGVVRRLMDVYRVEPSDGFAELVAAGRPELTLEAQILGSEFTSLFPDFELAWFGRRLAAAGIANDWGRVVPAAT
jgi:tRNA pseudouridine38-40 synthase